MTIPDETHDNDAPFPLGLDFRCRLSSSPDFDDPSSSKTRPRGTTGSAGLLEPGVSRVSRDAPPRSASGADDGDDDDDLFAVS